MTEDAAVMLGLGGTSGLDLTYDGLQERGADRICYSG